MSLQQPASIRVLIADGDPRVGRALVRLLHDAADVEVVATAADAATALECAGQLRPAIVLVDAGPAPLDGLALTRRLRETLPTLEIIVVGVYATSCAPALAAGACQFLLKDCSRAELVAAIRLVAQGHCQVRGSD
jgi:two-component system response regulator DesR